MTGHRTTMPGSRHRSQGAKGALFRERVTPPHHPLRASRFRSNLTVARQVPEAGPIRPASEFCTASGKIAWRPQAASKTRVVRPRRASLPFASRWSNNAVASYDSGAFCFEFRTS